VKRVLSASLFPNSNRFLHLVVLLAVSAGVEPWWRSAICTASVLRQSVARRRHQLFHQIRHHPAVLSRHNGRCGSHPLLLCVYIRVSVNLYSIALSHSASSALSTPNTAVTSASSVGDRSWRCRVLDHAGRCRVRSRRSDQSRRMHDGRTYRAVFLARQVGGLWLNESAVVRWLCAQSLTRVEH